MLGGLPGTPPRCAHAASAALTLVDLSIPAAADQRAQLKAIDEAHPAAGSRAGRWVTLVG